MALFSLGALRGRVGVVRVFVWLTEVLLFERFWLSEFPQVKASAKPLAPTATTTLLG